MLFLFAHWKHRNARAIKLTMLSGLDVHEFIQPFKKSRTASIARYFSKSANNVTCQLRLKQHTQPSCVTVVYFGFNWSTQQKKSCLQNKCQYRVLMYQQCLTIFWASAAWTIRHKTRWSSPSLTAERIFRRMGWKPWPQRKHWCPSGWGAMVVLPAAELFFQVSAAGRLMFIKDYYGRTKKSEAFEMCYFSNSFSK